MELMYIAIGVILTTILFVAYHTLYIVSMLEEIYDSTVGTSLEVVDNKE